MTMARLKVLHLGKVTRALVITSTAAAFVIATNLGCQASTEQITGKVTGLFIDSPNPQIQITSSVSTRNIPINTQTNVTVKQNRGGSTKSDIGVLDLGDIVSVSLQPDGVASTISMSMKSITGSVTSMTSDAGGAHSLTLNYGSVYSVDSSAEVSIAGRQIGISDLSLGQKVRLRLGALKGNAYAVDVVGPGNAFREPVNTVASGQPVIFSCQSDIAGPMRAGQVIHFLMHGTPQKQAAVDISKIGVHLDLEETSQGIYTGIFNIPAEVNAKDANIIGSLSDSLGSNTVTLADKHTLTIDNGAPVITAASPIDNSETTTSRPQIYAIIGDGDGVGINETSVRLQIDGVDDTRLASLTPHFISYQPPLGLAPGQHLVSLVASDIAGNRTEKSWTFSVRRTPAVAPSFTSDRSGGLVVLKSGQSVVLKLIAGSGGSAFATYANMNIPLNETSAGQYVGRLTATAGASNVLAPVTAHYTGSDHNDLTINLPQEVQIMAGAPEEPQIEAPRPGQHIGKSIVVAGKTTPGCTVEISIGYAGKAYSLMPLTGLAAQTKVVADQDGRWSTETLALSSPTLVENASKTKFTVSATSVDNVGQKSRAVKVVVLN